MKKNLIIVFFGFFWTTYLNADEPEYSSSLNENIIEYGWEIKNTSSLAGTERTAVEVITLSKNNWILKCSIHYYPDELYHRCWLP